MTTVDPRSTAIAAIELAVAHLADAVDELDRMPAGDRATVGLVAHALNNYVSVSDATLDLLGDALQEHPNPEVATWLTSLRHLGNLMQHTVGRLVHASAPSKFPLRAETFDIVKLIRRACHYYATAAERKGLTVVCQPLGDIPPAYGDRVAVALVADTLLSNAVKHSRPDGTIVVQLFTGPGGVVCSVRDHGPGPDPVEQAQLIHSGVRLGTGARPGKSSPGYGLTIAKELIDRLGGQLRFEVTEGGGACFSFRIPYAPSIAGPGPGAESS